MNDKKKNVVKVAHQLFIEKGFQSTSIQDILDVSGIAKGTFYKYFSSKNELFTTLFKMILKEVETNRNELLIGEDPSNIEIFIKQIELQMKLNQVNKLVRLYEEVFFSKDKDLKQLVNAWQMNESTWLYHRFIDLFGEDKKPYLLDCAVMFAGILHYNIRYYNRIYGPQSDMDYVVRYCVERIRKMVHEIAESEEQLLHPDIIKNWIAENENKMQDFQEKLYNTVLSLKSDLSNLEGQMQYIELLDFILDEFQHSMSPRKFLIDSALLSLETADGLFEKDEIEPLKKLIEVHLA
ncbi:TetR/AcrR family transcriptional regulator [Oceanobacillus chungangensis]|uniref:TetR/AcrR family transcriptional regulator n=1 Tax=Oceanobacillus chungangensis TaxID=1229152 RepID=A0A3D8PTH9_9BACI|nr:TetR/AcrR family transcriptional regulator [Oceanobacillus chungangensis]RDW19426.1 TetR/AcrR family transcriptional regulator [Oceanobacillus chungangensis]